MSLAEREAAARAGDNDKAFDLGSSYYTGSDLPEDHAKALFWYRMAAERGDSQAQLNVGSFYRFGIGTEADLPQARSWYRRAAEAGEAGAQLNLALMLFHGDGGPADPEAAQRWLRLAAEQGVPRALYQLGARLRRGAGIPQNLEEAAIWMQRAAEAGHVEAVFELGVMHEFGEGVPPNIKHAAHLYRRAAEAGHAEAQVSIGSLLLIGAGLPQDLPEAARWLAAAAEQGNPRAQNNLAMMLFDGWDGQPADPVRGLALLAASAKGGYTSAMRALGMRHRSGQDTPRDPQAAIYWLTEAAARGDGVAQFSLGQIYETGDGVDIDLGLARSWYEKSAQGGYGIGQFAFGNMLSQGIGGPAAPAASVPWYERAVAQGVDRAATALGRLFYLDGALEEDLPRAHAAFRTAVELGHLEAYIFYAETYRFGHGVARDLDRALALLDDAMEAGSVQAFLYAGAVYDEELGETRRGLDLTLEGLKLFEAQPDPSAKYLAQILKQSAGFRLRLGDAAGALRDAKARVDVLRDSLGPRHDDVGWAMIGLVQFEAALPPEEALALMKDAADIFAGNGNDDALAQAYVNQALIYRRQRDLRSVELSLQKALDHLDRAENPTSRVRAIVLQHYSQLSWDTGKYEQAAALAQQGIDMLAALGETAGEDVFLLYSGLGHSELRRNNPQAARNAYEQAAAVARDSLDDHPDKQALALMHLGNAEAKISGRETALKLYLEALALAEQAPRFPTAELQGLRRNIATELVGLRRFEEADVHLTKALRLLDDVPHSAAFRVPLLELAARSAERVGDLPRAFDRLSEAAEIARAEGLQEDGGNVNNVRQTFLRLVALAHRLHVRGQGPDAHYDAAAFIAAQSATNNAAARALTQLSVRFSAGSGPLAALVRERQDLLAEREKLAPVMLRAMSDNTANGVVSLAITRASLKRLDAQLAEVEQTLIRDFPDYADLADPQPLTQSDVQALLGPDEAVLKLLVMPQETHAWLLRRDRATWKRLPLSAEDLTDMVSLLRAGLDRSGGMLRSAVPLRAKAKRSGQQFDVETASRLHDALLGSFADELAGVAHLIFVPDGALQVLPPAVLVASPAEEDAGWAEIDWLIKHHAITVLPALSSLQVLRNADAPPSQASAAFAGFGDPVFAGADAGQTAAVTLVFRGGQTDLSQLRRLPPLPETRYELERIAQSLGAEESTLYLGNAATERTVKETDLSQHRVIAFATHGLIAGELDGLAEPALALTPPEQPDAMDDGLLTVSEVAQLRLDADWVLLSACNTAAGDSATGAEGLSGLARAFFYAGSRSLLVSHWPVLSDAAVALTTGAFELQAADPTMGRAEAMRQSMLALMAQPGRSHPEQWAPFVLVGEGTR